MAKRWQSWGPAAGVSAAAHLALALWAFTRPPPVHPDPTPTSVDIRFVVPPPPPPEPIAPPPVAPAPPRKATSTKRRRPPPPPPSPVTPPKPDDKEASEPAVDVPPTGPAGSPAPKAEPGGTVLVPHHPGDVRDPSAINLTLRPQGPGGTEVVTPRARPRRKSLVPGVRLIPRSDGGYDIKESQFSARITPDGSIVFKDKTALQRWHGLSFQIDVTDEVMRAAGDDPYRAIKQKIFNQTAALRAEMADRACEARLRRSVVELRGRLDRVWANTTVPSEQRRALLFGLWDDCAETGNEEVVRTGQMARATILAFIRKHLPEGSPQAFTRHELAELNRRRHSTGRFEPYVGLP